MLKTIKRRQFIRGLGGSLLAIPFMPSVSREAQAQEHSPKRFVSARSLYGQPEQLYYPRNRPSTEVGPNTFHAPLAAGEPISPLLGSAFAPVAHKLSLLRGIGLCGSGHNHSTMLAPGPFNGESRVPDLGTSMDEVLATSSIYDTPPAHRILRVNSRTGFDYSWKDGERQPYDDVLGLYTKLFPGGTGEDPDRDQATNRSRSALNLAMPGVVDLQRSSRISTLDQDRLSNYLDLLADSERRLAARAELLLRCEPPTLDAAVQAGYSYGNFIDEERFHIHLAWIDANYDTMMDLVVAALACDMTRVVSLSLASFGGVFGETGSTFHEREGGGSHWNYRHEDVDEGDPIAWPRGSEAEAVSLRMYSFMASKVGRLMSMMDSIVEANGDTLLDNSIVYFGNEQTGGAGHHDYSMPILVGGTGRGQFEPGYWDFTSRPFARHAGNPFYGPVGTRVYANFLVTLLHALGLERNEWESVQGGAGFGGIRIADAYDFSGIGGRFTFEEVYGDVTSAARRREPLQDWYRA
ncbi:MAG: DUF1552 domain-containing protein [Polyangiales bacterium]